MGLFFIGLHMPTIIERPSAGQTRFLLPEHTQTATATVNGVSATISSQDAFSVTLATPTASTDTVAITYTGIAIPSLATVTTNSSGDTLLVGPTGSVVVGQTPPHVDIFRTVNNVVETVSAPKQSRVLSAGGVRLFAFNQATPTPNANASVALGANYINRMATGQVLTCTTAGAISATYSGLNITAGSYDPAKHYILSLFNGSAGANSGFSLSLTGAAGKSQSWTISGTGLRPGWNNIFLCSPTDTVAQGVGTPSGYGSQTGVVQVNAPGSGGMGSTAITGISINFFSQAIGDFMVLDSIETATKVRPTIVFTYDQSPSDPGNLFAQVVPTFTARGLVGTCRYHSLNDKAATANCLQALTAGWDIVNGTFTRQATVSTAADVLKEYGLNQNEMSGFGFGKSVWANPPGNNSSSDTELCKAAFRQMGIKYSKGVSHNLVYHGVQGLSNPYSLGTININNGAYTVAQYTALIDAAIATGTNLIFFQHTLAAQLDITQLGQILDYTATKKLAGLIDVVTLTGLARILEGRA